MSTSAFGVEHGGVAKAGGWKAAADAAYREKMWGKPSTTAMQTARWVHPDGSATTPPAWAAHASIPRPGRKGKLRRFEGDGGQTYSLRSQKPAKAPRKKKAGKT